MKLIILRHGETTWNKSGKIQGQKHDSKLTKVGESQVRDIIKKLKNIEINHIYSSPMKRCSLIGKIISKNIKTPFTVDKHLKQKNWGKLEGMTRTEIGNQFPESGYGKQGKTADPKKKYAFIPPDGESWPQVQKRVNTFLKQIFLKHSKKNDTIVLIIHNAIYRVIVSYLAGIKNCCIFKKSIRPLKLQVINIRVIDKNIYNVFGLDSLINKHCHILRMCNQK